MTPENITHFSNFAPPVRPSDALRQAITRAYRTPEPACIPSLVEAATVSPDSAREIATTARSLIEGLRANRPAGPVQALFQEYALNSPEGVALMCLAEALLRIPDAETRDALIRDKLVGGDWKAHLGGGRSLFVNAATWGLVVSGKLVASADDKALGNALTRIIARLGEPVIRRAVDVAMRLMGEQFVLGETIQVALDRARAREARGFSFSYDMLGEAAMTAADAARYYASYEAAIHAIGKASAGRGIYEGPGISVKLSALHPRYSRAQAGRVMAELLPRVRELALLARGYGIGFNIDAEEADRLELSLDILQSLAEDSSLNNWNGLGFVIQAYQKRCPVVIDWIIALARRTGRRIMVRLVKGAYWDAEIKRAQVDGLADFPVYTRKVHTDVSYIACARKLLAAHDAVFPQFATHNAQTVATILHLAGPGYAPGDYEFQCLHGMGEPLYNQVVGDNNAARPCRIYAPVGTHETLLAYLVRRLLENGANSSFVHRIADPAVPVAELIEDPAAVVAAMPIPGAPHEGIALPANLHPDRCNSAGLDLSDELTLAALDIALRQSATQDWTAGTPALQRQPASILNPANHNDVVGHVHPATLADAAEAAIKAQSAAPSWAATSLEERCQPLERAADKLQERMPELLGLLIREAGKSAANAIAEVREAIDFLRYYPTQARLSLVDATPLGPVVCISPWNFPLAIFTGQLAAALVAGNPVLAKPSGETPLIAAAAVTILHEAGIPKNVLQLLPGDGEIGAALVAAPQTAGVVFTGSTHVARLIQRALAGRTTPLGTPIPFIAETGGQNAMIVDSSTLPEQVVADVLVSAFDSAGQRCSALRLLCLQEDIADRTLRMLTDAMAELVVGNPDRLAVDVGPVITPRARDGIAAHIAAMRDSGHRIIQLPLDPAAGRGTFVPPTLIEISSVAELQREVFGPVLHVLRYDARKLDQLMADINATGYGLTFGLHTRLDATIARVTSNIAAGNQYINRNTIGAVVGVQPFGGRGLSGTGPKAGGPLYLARLAHGAKTGLPPAPQIPNSALAALRPWAPDFHGASRLGQLFELPGPVGERNTYGFHPRGRIAVIAATEVGFWQQVAAILATGNVAVAVGSNPINRRPVFFPAELVDRVMWSAQDLATTPALHAALIEPGADVAAATIALAEREGPIVSLHAPEPDGTYNLDLLLEEITVSINTTAAGGNASLMALA